MLKNTDKNIDIEKYPTDRNFYNNISIKLSLIDRLKILIGKELSYTSTTHYSVVRNNNKNTDCNLDIKIVAINRYLKIGNTKIFNKYEKYK